MEGRKDDHVTLLKALKVAVINGKKDLIELELEKCVAAGVPEEDLKRARARLAKLAPKPESASESPGAQNIQDKPQELETTKAPKQEMPIPGSEVLEESGKTASNTQEALLKELKVACIHGKEENIKAGLDKCVAAGVPEKDLKRARDRLAKLAGKHGKVGNEQSSAHVVNEAGNVSVSQLDVSTAAPRVGDIGHDHLQDDAARTRDQQAHEQFQKKMIRAAEVDPAEEERRVELLKALKVACVSGKKESIEIELDKCVAAGVPEEDLKRAKDRLVKLAAAEELKRARKAAEEEEALRKAMEAELARRKAAEEEEERLAAEEEEARIQLEILLEAAMRNRMRGYVFTSLRENAPEEEALREAEEEEESRSEATKDARKQAVEEDGTQRKLAEEEDARGKVAEEEESLRKVAEVDTHRKAEEEESRKKAAEEYARKQLLEEEEEARRQFAEEENARRKVAEEEESRRRAAEEDARKKTLEEEEARRLIAEEEDARRKVAEEEDSRRKAAEEEELRRNAAEEDARQKAAAQRKVAAEELKRARKAAEEEEARRKAVEEELARRKAAEEEAERLAAEEEEARVQLEILLGAALRSRMRGYVFTSLRQKAAEEEALREAAEEEARRKAAEEDETRKKGMEEELARRKAAEEKEARTETTSIGLRTEQQLDDEQRAAEVHDEVGAASEVSHEESGAMSDVTDDDPAALLKALKVACINGKEEAIRVELDKCVAAGVPEEDLKRAKDRLAKLAGKEEKVDLSVVPSVQRKDDEQNVAQGHDENGTMSEGSHGETDTLSDGVGDDHAALLKVLKVACINGKEDAIKAELDRCVAADVPEKDLKRARDQLAKLAGKQGRAAHEEDQREHFDDKRGDEQRETDEHDEEDHVALLKVLKVACINGKKDAIEKELDKCVAAGVPEKDLKRAREMLAKLAAHEKGERGSEVNGPPATSPDAIRKALKLACISGDKVALTSALASADAVGYKDQSYDRARHVFAEVLAKQREAQFAWRMVQAEASDDVALVRRGLKAACICGERLALRSAIRKSEATGLLERDLCRARKLLRKAAKQPDG